MIVFLVIGILGYLYIMLFEKPGVLEILALISFALIANYTSGSLSNKSRMKYKLSDVISLLAGLGFTIYIFFRINR